MRETWDVWQERITAAVGRARKAMSSGATLDDVLCRFRTRDQLDTLDAEVALCRIASREMDPHTAEMIVRNPSGRSYAHLALADLELLGDAPSVGDVDGLTRHNPPHQRRSRHVRGPLQ